MKLFETISLFGKWWRTWHTLPIIAWVKGAACYRAGRYEVAENHYKAGLEKHPNHPASLCARLDLAYCLFKSHKLEEAEKQLKFITTHAPTSREGFLRLARLQLWMGNSLEAGWTMRRALKNIEPDAELAATFLSAVVESEAPGYLLAEAHQVAGQIELEACDPLARDRLELALARYHLLHGDRDQARQRIAEMASAEKAIFDVLLVFAELLVSEGKIAHARRQLRRAMTAAPDHPRLLSILANSYLRTGPFYNTEYATQLAIKACQSTNWLSAREMHVLAEAYYHHGDRVSALLIASKAKQVGTRPLGSYSGVRHLEQLIESLNESTLG